MAHPACLIALLGILSFAVGRQLPAASSTPTIVCESCILAAHVLENFLCDPVAEDLLVRFAEKEICPAWGDTEKCRNVAEGLIPVVMQWIKTTVSPIKMCSAVEICGPDLRPQNLQLPALQQDNARSDTSTCSICKMVLTYAKLALNDTQMQERVRQRALEMCSTLPPDLAQGCADFINTYEPLVVNFIAAADVNELCNAMGACTAAAATSARKVLLPGAKLSIGGSLRQDKRLLPGAVLKLKAGRSWSEAQGGASNDACDMCKMAVIEAHSLVTNPTVQTDMIMYAKALCDSFQAFQEECKVYVDQYAPLVFDLLQKYLLPDQLCVQIGVCQPPSLLQKLQSSLLTQNLARHVL